DRTAVAGPARPHVRARLAIRGGAAEEVKAACRQRTAPARRALRTDGLRSPAARTVEADGSPDPAVRDIRGRQATLSMSLVKRVRVLITSKSRDVMFRRLGCAATVEASSLFMYASIAALFSHR